MTDPITDPISAVRAADPYPYYGTLVSAAPFAFHAALGMFVAASAEAVTAVLEHPALGVRPAAKPIPDVLGHTAAGEVFGQLVRMTDGPRQQQLKRAVETALSGADLSIAYQVASRRAREALAEPAALRRLMFEVPVGVTAELCGLPAGVDVAGPVAAFVAGLPAAATVADGAGAAAATGTLTNLLGTVAGAGLTGALAATCGTDAAALANTIGLLSQTYDATAGLIGNSLLAAARDGMHDVNERYVREVARHDAPVQNTRRFAHADIEVLGTPVRVGQAVLVVLAAANRDPRANPDPDRFAPDRGAPALFTFGLGRHTCPGHDIATAVATAVVRTALAAGHPNLPVTRRYLPLANTRIPELWR